MFFKQGRYSGFLTPISYGIDLLVINLFASFLPINFHNPILFHSYISLAWIIVSSRNGFYEVYRYSKVTHILRLLFRSEEHTSELQSRENLVCRLLLEKKKK